MDNSVNFKGVFIINKPNVVLRQAIKSAGKLTQENIFPEYTGKNNFLYVVRDCFDKNVANILIGTPKAKFKYYPTLNNTSGFDTKNKQEALEMLFRAKDYVIKSKEKLVNIFKQKNRDILKTNIRRIQERNLKLISKETLIDFNDKSYRKCIDVQTGICKIFKDIPDKTTGKISRHTLVEITPPDQSGYCYAKYTPVSENEPIRRIAINKNGEKLFEYENYIQKYFKQNAKEAKRHYATQFQNQNLFIS